MVQMPKAAPEVTQEYVRSLLTYNEHTGELVWRRRQGTARAGQVAGYLKEEGALTDNKMYRYIRIGGKDYSAHRLVWLYHHGGWPTEIDHVNRDRSDNRLANLREVEHYENMANIQLPKSGYRGVYQAENGKYFTTVWMPSGEVIHLGRYKHPLIASIVHLCAKLTLLGARECDECELNSMLHRLDELSASDLGL